MKWSENCRSSNGCVFIRWGNSHNHNQKIGQCYRDTAFRVASMFSPTTDAQNIIKRLKCGRGVTSEVRVGSQRILKRTIRFCDLEKLKSMLLTHGPDRRYNQKQWSCRSVLKKVNNSTLEIKSMLSLKLGHYWIVSRHFRSPFTLKWREVTVYLKWPVHLHFHWGHLEDAFIQSDLQ